MDKTERTTAGLRSILFEQIEGVRDGKVTGNDANAVAKLALALLKSLEVEMAFLKLKDDLGKGPAPIELGETVLCGMSDPPPSVNKPSLPPTKTQIGPPPAVRHVPGKRY